MIALTVMFLAVSILTFYAKAFCEKLETESDPVSAEFWEDETRAFAWRWLARKQKAKAKTRRPRART